MSLPPLIVGVDVPDDALHEDLVLVEGDQGAESERGQDRQHDRGRRAVALEYLQGRELEIHNHSNFEVWKLAIENKNDQGLVVAFKFVSKWTNPLLLARIFQILRNEIDEEMLKGRVIIFCYCRF